MDFFGKWLAGVRGAGSQGSGAKEKARAAADAVARAFSLCDGGEHQEAGRICREILDRQPDHAGALHCLGVIGLREDRLPEAVALLEHARQADGGDVQIHYDLAEAYRLGGRPQDAAASYEKVVAARPAVMAARLGLAECQLLSGRLSEASRNCSAVLESEADNLRALMLAAELALRGTVPAHAEPAIRAAQSRAPQDPDLQHALAKLLIGQGRLPEAVQPLLQVLGRGGNDDAQHSLVRLVEAAVRARMRLLPATASDEADAGDGSMISVIICSIDREKFAAVTAHYHALLAGERYEIIGIHDARSLCEGYNRGVQQARGDILVFSHDDIEILTPDFAKRLRRHLRAHHVIGACGTAKVMDGVWWDAGWPHLRGLVAHHFPPGHADAGKYRVMVLDDGAENASGGVQALDGMFIAARREVLERCRFDEERFDGFHLYDLDFTYAASLAGFDVAAFRDITMVHYTYAAAEGYEDAFTRYRERFEAKYGFRWNAQNVGDRRFIPVLFDARDQIRDFCEQLLALRRAAETTR